MSFKDVGVIWVRPGVSPATSYEPRSHLDTDIRQAILDAQGGPPKGQKPDDEPWLRSGTGIGAAVVNRQGIELLKLVYNAGVASGKLI